MSRNLLQHRTTTRLPLLFIATVLAAVFMPRPVWAAKNVIVMIADGAGFNTWLATSMYQGRVEKQAYEQPGWLRLGCSTYPLSLSHEPTGDERQDQSLVYEPKSAWPVDTPTLLPDFSWLYLARTATDSAASATALATGRKTYNGAINWSIDNRPMRGQTIAEIAKEYGKSAGVVTTVPWSHATPAALGGAHNVSRGHCDQIANEMLDAPWLSVIMGAGHPNYDNDGQLIPDGQKRDYRYVGGQKTWESLARGERDWELIETKEDFEALTFGPTPSKVLGTAQVAATLQEKRGSGQTNLPYDEVVAERLPRSPFSVPLNRDVPSLDVMAQAAINCLDDDPDGFYLMIEGGAVDWANHANEPDRMIEEQVDFVKAIEAVVAWIESHGGWDETLLILTADHECGLLWGPKSRQVDIAPLEDRGAGKLPGMVFNSRGHSNSLVPLFARGPGSGRFAERVKGSDQNAADQWHFSGQWVDNTDVFSVMRAEVTKRSDEQPAGE